jgi:hypothetical protein
MKKENEKKAFEDWSFKWKGARKRSDVETILKLWQLPMPRAWERKKWEGKIGYRKRSANKGEQCIEKILFKSDSKGFGLSFSDQGTNTNCRIEAIYHNMPLANQSPGQVIADAFGVLLIGTIVRPLFIEVKDTANDPWFALVENLQQIRLARACAHGIKGFVHKKSKHQVVQRGVWGLILAPKKYYENHANNLAKCEFLLDALKKKTRARVAFGISDLLACGQIKIIAHNWF